VPLLTDQGYSLLNASLIASATAGFGVAGKLIFGRLVDRWDVRYALWLGIFFQILGQLVMLNAPGYGFFLLGACLFGFGMGGVVPMQGAVVGAAFGRASFGRVLGAMRPPMALIHLIGTPFAGWVYDTTGDYSAASVTFIILYLIAAIAVLGLSVNTRSSRSQSTESRSSPL